MTDTSPLRVIEARVLRYRMPLKRPYGTARGRTTAAVNFLFQLTTEHQKQIIEGIGECQPRHALTGDGDKDRVAAWGFACAAADYLQDRTLAFSGPNDATDAVRSTITELEYIAADHADDTNRDRPYRGTMLGIEVALLDVVSRALGLQISEMLGKKRNQIGISISTISSTNSLDSVPEKVIRQKRFPMTRVKGVGDIAHDLELLERVAQANRSVEREKPLWIDINEAMDFEGATRLVKNVAARMASGVLPASLVIEGVLPKDEVVRLPELQQLADERCQKAGTVDLDLRIMPDEGLWDKTDLERLNALGGCRAINIKAPKAGGLLPSLDLANAAVAANPDVHISIGGMVGTSDITTWALHNLARALPRLDYSTSVPPGNVEARISDPLVRYVARGSNIIGPQTSLGLGARLRADKVAPYIEATHGTSPRNKAMLSEPQDARRKSNRKVLVFAGDTSLGDVYAIRKGGELMRRLELDPMSFFEGLQPVLAGKDALVLNLETVLADSPISPFEGQKAYLGWDSPERTINCLKQLGVDAVSLANNHTMDYGERHLLETKNLLQAAEIMPFGAGETEFEAASPVTLHFDLHNAAYRVHIIGAMQLQARLRDKYQIYAAQDKAGVNCMNLAKVSTSIKKLRAADPSSLIILFPHWGSNYSWASDKTQAAASRLLEAGANMILGHGPHMLQQCTFAGGGASVYSLGNFLFNWAGRFDERGAPPFGLVARVGIQREFDHLSADLRLYPIVINNRKTDHRPRPVDNAEFERVLSLLQRMDVDGSFKQHSRVGADSHGLYITFPAVKCGPHTGKEVDAADAEQLSSVGRRKVAVPGSQHHGLRSVAASLNGAGTLVGYKLESHLLEREALAYGLCCARLSPLLFIAGRTRERIGEIAFHRTTSTATSRVAGDLAKEAEYLETLLRESGVPFGEYQGGGLYHALVIEGRVVSVLRHQDDVDIDVTEEAHQNVCELATRAIGAIPGLGYGDVQVSLEDHTRPTAAQRVFVTDVSVAPRLARYESASHGKPGQAVRAVLDSQMAWEPVAGAHGESMEVEMVLSGASPKSQIEKLGSFGEKLGLRVKSINGRSDYEMCAVVDGGAYEIAALSALSFGGSDVPAIVELRPMLSSGPEGRL